MLCTFIEITLRYGFSPVSLPHFFQNKFYLEQSLLVYFWLIQEFLKTQKESLFNNVFHHFSCLFSLGKFFFIVYQPRLMQTRVLFDLLKIANFCVEYQWPLFNSYKLRIVQLRINQPNYPIWTSSVFLDWTNLFDCWKIF